MNAINNNNNHSDDEEEAAPAVTDVRRLTGFNPRPVASRNNFSPVEIRRRTGFRPTLAKDRKPPPRRGNTGHVCPLKMKHII